MIVADTNLIVYLLISGDYTADAEYALQTDPQWLVPVSWRAEFLKVLSTYCRSGRLEFEKASEAWTKAREMVSEILVEPDPSHVLKLSMQSGCSGYDCIFVAAAQMNSVPLVTFDKKLLQEFPATAIRPDAIQAWFSARRTK